MCSGRISDSNRLSDAGLGNFGWDNSSACASLSEVTTFWHVLQQLATRMPAQAFAMPTSSRMPPATEDMLTVAEGSLARRSQLPVRRCS
jgi:hypothetical protein